MKMRIKSERLIKKYRKEDGSLEFLCPKCQNYSCCYDEDTDKMIVTALECKEFIPDT